MKSFTILIASFLLITSCKQLVGIPDNFDYGKVENNVYVNEFFGMSFPLTDGWEPLEKAFVDSIRTEGLKQLSESNNSLDKEIDASQIKTANLISLLKEDDNILQFYNANIAIMAENLKLALSVKDGKDYLESAKDVMLSTGIDLKVMSEITPFEIGGHKFYTMEVLNKYQDMEVHQDFYADIINGFGLAIVCNWSDNEQREATRKAIAGITFK